MDLKFKDNSKLKLAGFTQLEYIESTGTQYIDTGVLQSTIKKYELVWMGDEFSVPTLGGKSGGWGFNDSLISYLYVGGSIYYSSGNGSYVRMDGVTGVKYTEIYNDGTLSVNGQTGNLGTLQKNVNLTIFYGGGRYGKGKIYSMKIYDQSMNLIRDFLPVKDYFGVVCLYDNVSQTFFYNKGTGNFTAGPVVISISPVIPKITTLYLNNCPNISGYNALRAIQSAQSSLPAAQKLNRVRVDIGNVSGSLSELLQYAGMAGFNDNYEPQTKPRLVGTWTINDWYTQAQLSQAQLAFDGLTIVADPAYLIDFNQLAVQTLDSTKPNYNPAVAIILQAAGYGNTLPDPPIPGQTGRWFINKSQISSITSLGDTFKYKVTVTDVNKIVTAESLAYDFTTFNELELFEGITDADGVCYHCSKLVEAKLPKNTTTVGPAFEATALVEIKFPDSLTTINGSLFNITGTIKDYYIDTLPHWLTINVTHFAASILTNSNSRLFINNVELTDLVIPEGFTSVTAQFSNLKNLTSVTFPSTLIDLPCGRFHNSPIRFTAQHFAGIQTISGQLRGCLQGCYLPEEVLFTNLITCNCNVLTRSDLPAAPFKKIHFGNNLTTLNLSDGFNNCYSLVFIHLSGEIPPSVDLGPHWNKGTYKIYIGDGSSAANDDAILQAYLADTNWAIYSSKLDTWYNYLHPTS